jgi:hypothetical protein
MLPSDEGFLAYTTPKLARFEDRRIGILRACLVAVILAYVGIYQFWFKGEWAESNPVAGSSRLTIQQPTAGGCDPSTAGCLNAFRNKSELPYCAQASVSVDYPGSVLGCKFFAAPLPVGSELNGATLAVTRLQSAEQDNICAADADNCPKIFVNDEDGSMNSSFVADIESFTVALDHTAWVTRASFGAEDNSYASVSSRQKRGKLFVPKNDYLCALLHGHSGLDTSQPKLSAPCFVEPNTTGKNVDFFRVDVLLLASSSTSTSLCPLDDVNFENRT